MGIESVSYLVPGRESLEHPCAVAGHADRWALGDIERIEARLRGQAYSPHRHDTYALGLTVAGVQTFAYRGSGHASLPGQVIILHPDELHDGAAGTEDPLVYRMIYLPPELISAASGFSRSLPFSAEPVVTDPALHAALRDLLFDHGQTPDSLLLDDAVARVSDGLARRDSRPPRRIGSVARKAVLQAREMLSSSFDAPMHATALEAETGLDRYELSRHFRKIFGTSPHRYRMQRRLDHARHRLLAGATLATAAADAGFADQAHLTRQFRSTYGITPGRWLAAQKV